MGVIYVSFIDFDKESTSGAPANNLGIENPLEFIVACFFELRDRSNIFT
jgi:hypothetical protein